MRLQQIVAIAVLTTTLWFNRVLVSAPIAPTKIRHSSYVPDGYELAWSDEFSGNELDEDKWSHRFEGRMRGQGLLSRDSVTLQNGILSITTHKVDGVLHTGMISSNGKYEPKYGYIESRIKFQRMRGHHGSIWLQSNTYNDHPGDPATAGSEIDIVEFFGSERWDRGVGVNLYWLSEDGKKEHVGTSKLNLDEILGSASSTNKTPPSEICDDFHVFAVEWTENGYKYFIDGQLVLETSEGTSQRSEYLILSLLCEDWEAPKLRHDQLPDGMQVDYVRVYQR